jgi:hypothetical protein
VGFTQSSSFAPRGDSASRPSGHFTQSSNSASGGRSGSRAVALASTRQRSNPLQTPAYGRLHSPASSHEYQHQSLGGSVAYSSTRESVQPLPCSRECEQQKRDLQRQLEDAPISYSRLLEDYDILQRDFKALSDEAERMRATTDDTGPIITREEYYLTLQRGEDEGADLYGPSSSISGHFDSSRSIVGPD